MNSIRQHLIDEEIVTSKLEAGTGWVCLIGGLTDHLDAPQVSLQTTGGLPPYQAHNYAAAARPGLQVLVRGHPNTAADTEAKAWEVWEALHQAEVTPFLLITGVNNPIWLGPDDQNRPMWSINFNTIKRRS